jgi:hypothetical protein
MTLFARKEYSVIHQLFLHTWAQLPLKHSGERKQKTMTDGYIRKKGEKGTTFRMAPQYPHLRSPNVQSP